MKKLLAFAVGAAMSFGAYASPAIQLPSGPIFLKFTGQEQIAAGPGATTSTYNLNGKSVNEINWGVFVVTTMDSGTVSQDHNLISPGSPIFANGFSGGQITGMFYGIQAGTPTADNPFPATGGYVDLYWRDTSKYAAVTTNNLNPNTLRTSYDTATGFTDGTFLARLYFDSGMDALSSSNTIVGDTIPNSSGFNGLANSYASVDTSKVGLWTNQLNSDWFNTPDGTRDLRFKNSYDSNSKWNGPAGSNIYGAQIDDPGQAYALPEPDALSLMGLAMAGMGVALRRRQKSAK